MAFKRFRFVRTAPVDPSIANINNEFYDELAEAWWDPKGSLAGLHEMTPTRINYFHEVFARVLGSAIQQSGQFVDVGCGGGLVTERLAGLGYRIIGYDISERSLDAARRHADLSGIRVEYRKGSAYDLPLPTGSADGLVASDIFEHLHNLPLAVSEMARVLRPGGVLVFDTVNRTWLSLFGGILVTQIWLRLMPPRTHNWKLFIKPKELAVLFARFGLGLKEVRGLSPAGGILKLAFRMLKEGRFGPYEISRDLRISYIGYAVKAKR